MITDMDTLLVIMQDMQLMVQPEDELTAVIESLREHGDELDADELDLIAAAGNPELAHRNDDT